MCVTYYDATCYVMLAQTEAIKCLLTMLANMFNFKTWCNEVARHASACVMMWRDTHVTRCDATCHTMYTPFQKFIGTQAS